MVQPGVSSFFVFGIVRFQKYIVCSCVIYIYVLIPGGIDSTHIMYFIDLDTAA